MSATTKQSRLPPTQNIDNYNLYYVVDQNVGLTYIPNNKMEIVSGTASCSGELSDVPSTLDIGFDFKFNNTIYKNLHVSRFGWITLDSTIVAWDINDIFDYTKSRSDNTSIRTDMIYDHVLLSSWYSYLVNFSYLFPYYDATGSIYYDVFQDPDTTIPPQHFESEIAYKHITYNYDISKWNQYSTEQNTQFGNIFNGYAPDLTGVRYYRENNSKLGKRLIIRWNVRTKLLGLTFEIVLYENGRIEFRYPPLSFLNNKELGLWWPNATSNASTVGIFCGNFTGQTVMRDFGIELKHFASRQRYSRGGSIYDATFTDIAYWDDGSVRGSNNYIVSLTPQSNWPGKLFEGGMFVFQPQNNKRKILPRQQIKRHDIKSKFNSSFDDRKVLNIFSTQEVHYPTKLPRYFAGNTLLSQQNNDLFENTLISSGSITNMFEPYIDEQSLDNQEKQNSFNESTFDQQYTEFFLTGTKIDIAPGFQSSLFSKEKIELEFPISYSTQMLPTCSCMYYYDKNIRGFNLCYNDNYTASFGNQNRALDAINRYTVPEDYIGFNPYGLLCVSGTYSGTLQTGSYSQIHDAQSDMYINTSLNINSYKEALQQKYNNSICINQKYNANNNQVFTLPIEYPFLIEKAIIEIPIEAGDTWFSDRTTCVQPFCNDNQIISGTQFIDLSGPAVTCALFHQYSTTGILQRDLILSATFTHQSDNVDLYDTLQYVVGDERLQLCAQGFNIIGPATSVIPRVEYGNSFFTGSVSLYTKPQTVAGCIATARTICYTSSSITNRTLLSGVFANPLLNVNNISTTPNTSGTTININSITNFGRSQGGFIDSGQSVLGNEILANNKIENFVNIFSGSAQAYDYWINQYGAVQKFIVTFPIPLVKFKDNPYLIYPNQTLVFAVSKTRPRFRGTTGDPYFYDSFTHDIKIATGSAKITLFGSYIKENKETIINKLSQQINYDVNTVISDVPVLDQFNVVSNKQYYNTYNDIYMSGSLFTTNGTRTKKFNLTNASHSSGFELIDGRLSTSLVKQFERANTIIYSKQFATTEFLYDCLIPNPVSIIKAITGRRLILNAPSNNYAVFLMQNSWQWAFPRESRYSNFPKLLTMPKNYITVNSGSYTLSKSVPGFIVDYNTFAFADSVGGGIKALSQDDSAKILYGFGDLKIFSGSTCVFNNCPETTTNISIIYIRPNIRGWKYGMYSGLMSNTSCVFRRDKFGQPRDMLEQRIFSPFFYYDQKSGVFDLQTTNVVDVSFINPISQTKTTPELTWSSNLSTNCTSSLPYFDEISTNRPPIDVNTMNLTLQSISTNNNSISI